MVCREARLESDDAVSVASLRPGSQGGTELHGFFKVGFTIDNFDATIDSLRARGVSFAYGPFPRRGDRAPNVIIRDNAGNMIQVFEHRGNIAVCCRSR